MGRRGGAASFRIHDWPLIALLAAPTRTRHQTALLAREAGHLVIVMAAEYNYLSQHWETNVDTTRMGRSQPPDRYGQKCLNSEYPIYSRQMDKSTSTDSLARVIASLNGENKFALNKQVLKRNTQHDYMNLNTTINYNDNVYT
ncbi:hypothetical protein J6590_029644 [Homalodisca vitripennis]|nr:hypothetical protein J6590_029644 [Homalodisca vitripennis]